MLLKMNDKSVIWWCSNPGLVALDTLKQVRAEFCNRSSLKLNISWTDRPTWSYKLCFLLYPREHSNS
jgi:hypothetical protein